MKKIYCLWIALYLVLHPLWAEDEKNRVIVCENGLEMFHWDLDFLREAQYSVEVLACFFGGDIAQELLTTIEKRLAEVPQLQVYVLASPIFIQSEDYAIISRLQQTYPHNFHLEWATQVIKFLPDLTTIDNHVKMFVVDETYFSTGGTNLEEKHCSEGTYTPQSKPKTGLDIILPAGMRDQDIVGRGPLAKELRREFYQFYALWEHYNATLNLKIDPKVFRENNYASPIVQKPFVQRFEKSERCRDLAAHQIKLVMGGPHQYPNHITEEYVRLIEGAQEEIIMEHLYFFPTETIFQALIDAVKRGVKLTLITNGVHDLSPVGSKLFGWGNRISYAPLFYGDTSITPLELGNTHIYEYYVRDMFLHKKIMLIDKRKLVMGSYNLSFKSAHGDYELILVIDSEEVAKDIQKVHERDLKYSKEITPLEAYKWYFDFGIYSWGIWQSKMSGFM